MDRKNNSPESGFTFSEAIPALIIFSLSMAVLLGGFLQWTRPGFMERLSAGGGPVEAAADTEGWLNCNLSEIGSDPWEPPPEFVLNENELYIRFWHNGRSEEMTLTWEQSPPGELDKTVLTLTLPGKTLRKDIPLYIKPVPVCDTRGILKGIGTEPVSCFIPLGRQSP